MRGRLGGILATLLLASGPTQALAHEPEIRSVSVSAVLHRDGSASLTEQWDVTVADGTEWYLVRSNLDDIEISGLEVRDENGRLFTDVGEWDVSLGIDAKAGKSGMVHKDDGVELCWGVGSYGRHSYTVKYNMSRVVRGLEDCDLLHLQLVSPGLSSPPEHVSVSIGCDFAQIDTSNARAWGFGFIGECSFSDGKVLYSSSEPFRRNSSVIALIRFDKGLFSPAASDATTFDKVFDKAAEGSDYAEDGDDGSPLPFLILFLVMAGIVSAPWLRRRQILGVSPRDIDWCREIPFNGDLSESAYVTRELGLSKKEDTIAAALILRMIHQGQLSVGKDSGGKVELAFSDRRPQEGDKVASGLYDMMREASGSDNILQEKEFSKWAKKHGSAVAGWTRLCRQTGQSALVRDQFMTKSGKFLPEGQKQARMLAGLKKFLLDFTLVSEREAAEAVLWKEYMVYGALLGIADKVAAQLKEIKPELFEQIYSYDYPTIEQVLLRSMLLSRAITNSNAAYAARTSRAAGGFGGGTSFGGGGGFHGGGFGGGSR